MVEAAMATNGVAVVIPTTIANRGMAIRASPKPRAERVNVDRKRMAMTHRVDVIESMSSFDQRSRFEYIRSAISVPRVFKPNGQGLVEESESKDRACMLRWFGELGAWFAEGLSVRQTPAPHHSEERCDETFLG
jgi:hypothetical protein